MTSFEMVHQQRVVGKLACFDRLIFKGHLAGLFGAGRFKAFLASQGVQLKDFAPHVKRVSEQVKAHALDSRQGCLGNPARLLSQGDRYQPAHHLRTTPGI